MKHARLIGLSGTHGTGKSTIINGIAEAGYQVDRSQLSRAAQKALGWETLSLAQESKENMWALQNAVMEAMFDRDQAALSRGEVVLVERTPADIWAYTEMWCGRLMINPVTDPQAIMYKQKCREMARSYAHFLVVPMAAAIPFVAEANRADLASRNFVDQVIREFIESGDLRRTTIRATGKEGRIAEAASVMSFEKIKGM